MVCLQSSWLVWIKTNCLVRPCQYDQHFTARRQYNPQLPGKLKCWVWSQQLINVATSSCLDLYLAVVHQIMCSCQTCWLSEVPTTNITKITITPFAQLLAGYLGKMRLRTSKFNYQERLDYQLWSRSVSWRMLSGPETSLFLLEIIQSIVTLSNTQ